ncbi:hypothetical protein B0H17DRAFT_1149266 [Mycena rosella]|uniref:Transmembrane protein n=1 Tax=Mycena rosella TaxID=1033263 RepID=A0AAD7C383_MYCRO|nr:hypothetical protein B0H17DRAFT_1149266 [Mycena rosella]
MSWFQSAPQQEFRTSRLPDLYAPPLPFQHGHVQRVQKGPKKKRTKKAAYMVFWTACWSICEVVHSAFVYARTHRWARSFDQDPPGSPGSIGLLPTPSQPPIGTSPMYVSETLDDTCLEVQFNTVSIPKAL